MITIIEPEDIKHIFSNLDKINERTKRHTKKIQELQREVNRMIKKKLVELNHEEFEEALDNLKGGKDDGK